MNNYLRSNSPVEEMQVAARLLLWYREMGVDEVWTSELQVCEEEAVRLQAKSALDKGVSRGVGACRTLCALRETMEKFEDCSLKFLATQTVFSDGNPRARVMLIGEAPGADEDRLGRPFVGMSGKLLDKMLSTIGLNRETVYITNIIPWRPPGNRQPTPGEVALCLPFVQKHIALVAPEFLVFLGGVACKSLLDTTQGITRLRGQWLPYQNPYLEASHEMKVMATYHPAYILRSPGQKKEVWHDLLRLQQELNSGMPTS